MKLEVLRVNAQEYLTSELIFYVTDSRKFLAHTIEDLYREEKIKG